MQIPRKKGRVQGMFSVKRLLLSVLITMVGLFALTLGASCAEQIVALRAIEGVVIDGNLDEWNLSHPLLVGQKAAGSSDLLDNTYILQTSFEGNRGGTINAIDYQMKFYVMWDENALYMAGEVIDDILADWDFWGGDRVEILFNAISDRPASTYPPVEFKHVKGTFRIFWRAFPYEDPSYPQVIVDSKEESYAVCEDASVATVETDTGWNFEVRIPWQVLQGVGEAEREYGMNVWYGDGDFASQVGNTYTLYTSPTEPILFYDWGNLGQLILVE
jgi:hypothetical protein